MSHLESSVHPTENCILHPRTVRVTPLHLLLFLEADDIIELGSRYSHFREIPQAPVQIENLEGLTHGPGIWIDGNHGHRQQMHTCILGRRTAQDTSSRRTRTIPQYRVMQCNEAPARAPDTPAPGRLDNVDYFPRRASCSSRSRTPGFSSQPGWHHLDPFAPRPSTRPRPGRNDHSCASKVLWANWVEAGTEDKHGKAKISWGASSGVEQSSPRITLVGMNLVDPNVCPLCFTNEVPPTP